MKCGIILAGLVVWGLVSCTAPPAGSGLGDVQAEVSRRLGRPVPVTNSDSAGQVNALLAKPLSMELAIEIALLNNRRMRATLEEIGISRADWLAANTLSNPKLAASTRWPSGGGSPDVEFQLSTDVLDMLLLPLKSKMAAHDLEGAKLRVIHEVMELVANVKVAYYQAIGAEQAKASLHKMLEVNQATADLANRVHEAGNINELELLTRQTGAYQTEADERHAKAEVSAARTKLCRLLGVSESAVRWRNDASLNSPPSRDPDASQAVATALAERADLAAACQQVASLQVALRVRQSTRFLPGLNLGVDTERQTDGPRITGPTLDAEVPLFNWGTASIHKLEAQLRQAQAEQEAVEQEVRNDVEGALSALRAAREEYDYQTHTLLPHREKVLQATLLHYNAMQKSPFELLLAKEEQQRAQQESINVLKEYWVAHAELERAMGMGLQASRTKGAKATQKDKN